MSLQRRLLEVLGFTKPKRDLSITQAMRMRLAVEQKLNEIEAALPDEDRFFLSDYPEKYREQPACAIRRPQQETAK